MPREHRHTQIATAPARTVVVGKMAALLLQELDGSEISKLPKTVQNKLEKILSDQQYEIDSLKALHEQFRVDSGKILPGVNVLFADGSGAKLCRFKLLTMHPRRLTELSQSL